ncbi:MAG: nuclear transport factor 2 family protein [Xenococcaceae cyanobacterium MO_188.B19]|nr:nuclear transport factor 2 family protein [Xenococcaceae cyanobacterium MO_188.B19]
MTNLPNKETVLERNQAFYNAFSERDINQMSLVWWQGSTSLCIHPGGNVLIGWDIIRDSWKSIFRNTDFLEIDLEIIKVEIDQALGYVVVGETVLQSSRGRKFQGQSIGTNVFQKMAQKWYLVSHHGSPIMR